MGRSMGTPRRDAFSSGEGLMADTGKTARQLRYLATEKGKAATAKYEASEKRKANHREAQAAYKKRLREKRKAVLL